MPYISYVKAYGFLCFHDAWNGACIAKDLQLGNSSGNPKHLFEPIDSIAVVTSHQPHDSLEMQFENPTVLYLYGKLR